MAFIDDLITRRNNIAAELAVLDATKAGGLPNAQGNPDEVGYKDGLYRELDRLNALIAEAGGPVEINVYGRV